MLTVEQLTFCFPGRTILERATFRLPPATMACLLGGNAEFFLEAVAEQPASEISYGQQKLLTLACCAALDAKLLLLDEPVASISPEYRERIAERLAGFKAAGKTILLIEHQPDFLERTGDAFLYLDAGRLHAYETLAELRATPLARATLT